MKPYEEVELTEEEIKAAILEGKKKKYFHVKNKGYWEAQEQPKKKLVIKDEKELL